ncbi:hypothetical protein OG298_01020 [Streptomyces sp. NBC_01005]|uniref:hypothetical protein n=1 Tax=unclassified Streptomyces TaxID=2593676 RepID=UPI002E2F0277|nr:hypothetical protein [Streptomyces sp. NBC_01362]WSW03062.1 hypothetical protein OG298_01020 [Streptomyces sp. NBC_01005]WTC92568.1 hypothetical protein OH736_01025 [Streptomyces sp. NBC_01650]
MTALIPVEAPSPGAGLFVPTLPEATPGRHHGGMLAVFRGLTGCADKTERPYIHARVTKPTHGMVTASMTGPDIVDYRSSRQGG